MTDYTFSPKDNIATYPGADGAIISLDFKNNTISFKLKECSQTYKFSQISSINLNIERDDLFLYGTRKLIAKNLLMGPIARILNLWNPTRKIKRKALALCQRRFVHKISHEIILNGNDPKTHELIFLQGPHLCSSQKVQNALQQSGLWLNQFAKITMCGTAKYCHKS